MVVAKEGKTNYKATGLTIAATLISAWIISYWQGSRASVDAMQDYMARDQERAVARDRRVDKIENDQTEMMRYLQRIDSRTARMEGALQTHMALSQPQP